MTDKQPQTVYIPTPQGDSFDDLEVVHVKTGIVVDNVHEKELICFTPEELEALKTKLKGETEINSDIEQFCIDQINQSYNEHLGTNEAIQDAAYFISAKVEALLQKERREAAEKAWNESVKMSANKAGMPTNHDKETYLAQHYPKPPEQFLK